MKKKFYPLKVLLISIWLCSIYVGVYAQTMTTTKSVENFTTGSDGSTATQGDILIYTISIANTSASNFIATRLYDNIPAGTSYVAGSTTLNGVSAADVSGRMPFSSTGGLINSPSYGVGILAPGAAVTVEFQVQVTANGGTITNNATVDGTYNSVSIVQTTNSVITNINADATCNTIYEITPTSTGSNSNHRVLRTINTSTGASSGAIIDGGTCNYYNAMTNAFIGTGPIPFPTSSAAIAYDQSRNRIYFCNTVASPQDLMYFDLTAGNVKRFVGQVVENTNTSVNRMTFGSDGYGYALTSQGEDLIRFSVDASNNLTITRLGALTNDPNNGTNNIRSAVEVGGDIFADGSGKLYLIANSSHLYKINPNTRVATFMGSVNPFPGTSQSMAINAAGEVFIGGAYSTVYKINLSTMAATSIGTGHFSADFTSCGFPVLASGITADKTAANYNGSATVVGGDTVIYTITVTNTGNINAAGVKLYDYIPPSTTYLPNSTTLNGSAVADVSGVMPFAVSGGRLVNSPGESGGIIKPGAANSAVVTFAVITEANRQICNQSKITLLDADGNIIFVNSSDPNNPGQTPTCFYSDGVLPSNNLKFKGSLNNDMSVLHWTVSEDPNIASYEIEYSENGISFNTIGKVSGKDNGLINSYEYTDTRNIYSSLRFYRLKIIQKGGSATYSGTVRLNVKGLDIQVIPNPFDKELNVQLQLKSKEQVRIRLIDFYGREVYTSGEQLSAGSHSLSLRVPSNLAKGMYVLEITAGNNHLFQKKVLKR